MDRISLLRRNVVNDGRPINGSSAAIASATMSSISVKPACARPPSRQHSPLFLLTQHRVYAGPAAQAGRLALVCLLTV